MLKVVNIKRGRIEYVHVNTYLALRNTTYILYYL
jgi:hypothetical protein